MKKFLLISGLVCCVLFLLFVTIIGAVQASTTANNAVTTVDADWHDSLEKAKENVISRLKIKNDINSYALAVLSKAIAKALNSTQVTQSDKLEEFIEKHFVKKEIIEYTVKNEDGKTQTKTKTIYLFLAMDELQEQLTDSPYFFPKDLITELQDLFVSEIPAEGNQTEFTGNFIMPIKGNITSGYGWRSDPLNGASDFHTGIDIAGKWHDDVITVADGEVVQVNNDSIYGNYILIKHEEVYSFYAHLSQQLIAVGDMVQQGDTIGIEGGQPNVDLNTGRTTGHHLHFSIYLTPQRSSHVSPHQYLNG